MPKLFRAGVYDSLDELRLECRGLEPDTEVIVSQITNFTVEARCFVLDGTPQTCAVYEGAGDANGAIRFVAELASTVPLPETCVLDTGLIDGQEWALVEANATWGSGLNGCDAGKAAICIARACQMEAT